MRFKNFIGALIVAATCAIVAPRAPAQQPCQPPQPPPPTAGQNIFTPQQEMDLGNAVAEQVQKNFRVIDDPELLAYLRRVGDRVAKQAPDVGLRFQFFIFDLPDANAFTLPGGRIYVSRKLIALAHSEDELAGVIAHEIGHGAARQMPVEMTRRFRELLGVTSVTDRRDIFEKYNLMVENAMRKPGLFAERGEDKNQEVADQIGFYALVRAGYDPQAQASLWDRVTETKGKTGNFFSDLFGTTKPESKRLREMLRSAAQLPASCVQPHTNSSPEEFQKWQTAVVAFTGTAARESVHGVVAKTILEPPLRGDVTHLKFSPDGKYVLAQDDTGINVLTREPFAPIFRIDAPEAYPAQFTPDSQSITFHTPTLRVETWSVADRKLASAHEMYVRQGCMQAELAPDGRTLACLEPSTDLTLFDVATGAQVFQKKEFFKPSIFDVLMIQLLAILDEGKTGREELHLIGMSFTPDGRYFAAGDRSQTPTVMGVWTEETTAIALDINAPKSPLPLRDPLKRLLGGGDFAFLAPDKLIAVDPQDMRKSAIVKFPSGEAIDQFPISGRLDAASNGNYVLMRPIQGFAAGVMDLTTKKIVLANKLSAMDVWGDFYLSERINGELGLYRVQGTQRVGVVVLPRNPLGILRAAAVSPDFKWLAVSERSRGAVWNLERGERVMHVRGFRGAHFGGDDLLYADFPAEGGAERTIAKVNVATREAGENVKFDKGAQATQYGAVVLLRQPLKKGSGSDDKSFRLEARDATTGASLWSKEFAKEQPRYWASDDGSSLVLAWATSSRTAKEEIAGDQRLTRRLAEMKEKEGDYFLEVLDAHTGSATGKLLVETGKGSFRVRDVEAAGDYVVITDSENRVLVYSLSTGEQRGRFFGDHAAVSKATGLLAVENERGQLSLYDLATAEKRDAYTFPAAVSLARFSDDGRRLFVLTANQTAYVIDPSKKE
jgi:WD40 repeat protein